VVLALILAVLLVVAVILEQVSVLPVVVLHVIIHHIARIDPKTGGGNVGIGVSGSAGSIGSSEYGFGQGTSWPCDDDGGDSINIMLITSAPSLLFVLPLLQ